VIAEFRRRTKAAGVDQQQVNAKAREPEADGGILTHHGRVRKREKTE